MDKNEQTLLAGVFNAKTITSAGGILLALLMSWYLYKITSNHLDHIDRAILEQTEVTRETNQILIKNAEAIVGNTEVLRILERRLK